MTIFKTHLTHQSPIVPTLPKPKDSLRLLHTSDWHLGKLLYNQSRYDEFAKFLDWLIEALTLHQVDILIVAGDIFDTMTPSNRAEHLYHHFLASAFKNHIQHIIIVAGNHDSPTSLQKTKEVLGVLNTHVIDSVSQDKSDELIVLTDDAGIPSAIVMAVPYIRDRDVRSGIDANSIHQKNQLLLEGVAEYYHSLTNLAKDKQQAVYHTHKKTIPIIATGHLYAAGAAVSSTDDGMRDIQIGTLGQISSQIFDDAIDYVALGHIHAAQKVGQKNHIRYSGSPIAMGFGEIGRHKQVLIVDLPLNKSVPISKLPKNDDLHGENQDNNAISIHSLPVPIFHSLAKICGDMAFITNAIDTLKTHDEPIWLEIEYVGDTLVANLKQHISNLLEGSNIAAISIKNKAIHQGSLKLHTPTLNLETLDEMDIFYQRLDKENLNQDEKNDLIGAYQELIKAIQETDHKAV